MEDKSKLSPVNYLPKSVELELQNLIPTNQAKSELDSKPQQLKDWYIKNVIKCKPKNAPRLVIFQRVELLWEKYLQNPKHLNSVFLNDQCLCEIIAQASDFVDIGFTLMKSCSLQKKKKEINYGQIVMNQLKKRFHQLFEQNKGNRNKILRVSIIESFIDQKQMNRDLIYDMAPFDREMLEGQIYIMLRYVFLPMFNYKTPTSLYEELTVMVMWMVVITDDSEEKELTLLDLAKKIDIYICQKKTETNLNFFHIFSIIMDLLSIKYTHDDPFRPETLAAFLNTLQGVHFPIDQFINNWIATRSDKVKMRIQIQYIMRNALYTGSIILAIQLIQSFQRILKSQKNWDTLFHIFQTFIRKDYINLHLPNASFVSAYFDILNFYVVGFINRDRLDGETQLDKLTDNLREMMIQQSSIFDRHYRKIIMFYKIYENRFNYLSNSSKKFMQNLQSVYQCQINVSEIHNEVSRLIFNQSGNDYEIDDIYSLKRSERYLGLANLGNTCYINSFMQALYMTKQFKSLVIETRDASNLPRGMTYFETLIKLFTELSRTTFSFDAEVDPLFFKSSIPEPFKSSWDQHDSGEFGRMYLDSLSTEVKNYKVGKKLENMFTHLIRQQIICKKCGFSREKTEKIFDFILNFNEDKTQTLTISELLANFFKENELDQKNKIYCKKCNKDTQVIARPQPEEFAEYLIATTSIFRYDGIKGKKLIKPLNFEFTLNLKTILPKYNIDAQYQLYAFIVHMGESSDCGHYVCYARNLEQNPMIWYNFNDHYVTEREIKRVDDFKFGKNETPYILFYSSSNKHRSVIKR